MTDIRTSLRDLRLAYSKFFSDLGDTRAREVLALYGRKLSDMPEDVLAAAIDDLINTARWFPTIAEIREACAERMLLLPNEGEALTQIEARMEWTRQNEDDRATQAPHVHSLVQEALDHVGGFSALRSSEDPSVIRGQFGRLYREARSKAVRGGQVARLPQLEAEGLPVSRHTVS